MMMRRIEDAFDDPVGELCEMTVTVTCKVLARVDSGDESQIHDAAMDALLREHRLGACDIMELDIMDVKVIE